MSKQSLEHYQTQRAVVEDKLERGEDVVQNFNSQTGSVNQLNARLEILVDARKDFEQLQYEIEQLDKTTTADNHRAKRIQFEDRYCNVVAKIKDIIDRASSSISSNNSYPASTSNNNQNSEFLQLNLPVLNLNTFSGNYKEWLNFENTFKSVIDENRNLNPRQRFQYLKSCLRDEALRAVDSLQINDANYKTAWELLENRFKNTRLIVQDHVFSILNAPSLSKASHTNLRDLLDKITSNITSLKSLEIPVDTWDAILVPIIVEKLDYSCKREWQMSLGTTVPKYNDLVDFLSKRCLVLESLYTASTSKASNIANQNNASRFNNQSSKSKTINHATTHNSRNFLCLFCKNTNHNISQCENFLKLNISQRSEEIKNLKLCLNCLRNNHTVAQCRSNIKCRTCNKKHHSLLHIEPTEIINSTISNHSSIPKTDSVLLSTAIVLIKNSKGEFQSCRAFLDAGSMSSYITKSLAEKLGLTLTKSKFQIMCLNQSSSVADKQTTVQISSKYNAFSKTINCLVINKITEDLPLSSINISNLEIPQNIKLADPEFYKSNTIDLLLGAGLFWELLCVGQIKTESGLIFQKTQLGFIAGGTYNNTTTINRTSCNSSVTNEHLDKQLQRFWELDNFENPSDLTTEEMLTEKHFRETTTRDFDGRFIVKLPIKNSKIEIGNTKASAIKRFFTLERKLDKDPELKFEYTQFIKDYHNLNHMELVAESVIDENNCAFLPHHAVYKQSSTTTKLRVVFDASLKSTNGYSFNENLMMGPVIQDDLFSILLRFRSFEFVLSGDITKMYRQIRIHPEHSNFHLIFWRDNADEPLNIYRLKTLTYGTKPASFIATRCLKELAIQNQTNLPEASKIVARDFYMDDLLTGANTKNELSQIKHEIIDILSQGQFELRKFQSNIPDLVTDNSFGVDLNKNELSKILGLSWNSTSDIFKFEIYSEAMTTKVTKRTILSSTAQIFDPLGLLGPVIMQAKITIQKLWTLKINWDESIPLDIQTSWRNFLREIDFLRYLNIPRKVLDHYPDKIIELHGFCDASQWGYGACIYVRTIDDKKNHESRLLCSKSRVAPLKTITLPRLELCGALLLAKLISKVRETINLHINREVLWTDSSIVLAWINSPSCNLKTFISNRIAEIQSLTKPTDWKHIKSENNAADILSRGCSPKQLSDNQSWFTGPNFLRCPEQNWPDSKINISHIEIPELRVTLSSVTEPNELIPILNKFSTFDKLQRVFAYMLRFIHNCKNKNNGNLLSGCLTSDELRNASRTIIKLVQKDEFTLEINNLEKEKPLNKNSKLLSLSPFLDDNQIIRVGGRLKNANLKHDTKYPIILPKSHIVTKLLVKQFHERHLHAGPQATLTALHQQFWILSGRSIVKQVLHRCIKCFKAEPKSSTTKMGNLPISRVQSFRPFLVTGVDYAGPIQIKEGRGRGKRLIKSYIAIFICFSTKAIHIELVLDLSANDFLAALKRFIGRRGLPTDMHSDNGTNFVGTNNTLKEVIEFFKKNENKHAIINETAKLGIKWHFTPPKSPHMGGLWESNVKAIKRHLKRTVGNANLTFDEMQTFLVRVEACLNSRPLTPLSSNPNDLETLTPGHFLIGQPLTELPEYDLSGIPENRLSRWQLVERIRCHFWSRWSKEYLIQLQTRTKWAQNATTPLEVGDMVILIEDNLPPLQWKIGRVVETHPGDDGNVRVVTVRTTQGSFRRATRKVCKLPIDSVA